MDGDTDTDPGYPRCYDPSEIKNKKAPPTGRRLDIHQSKTLIQPNGHPIETEFGCRVLANHNPVNPGRQPIPRPDAKDRLHDIRSRIKGGVSIAQRPFQPGDLVSQVSVELS